MSLKLYFNRIFSFSRQLLLTIHPLSLSPNPHYPHILATLTNLFTLSLSPVDQLPRTNLNNCHLKKRGVAVKGSAVGDEGKGGW